MPRIQMVLAVALLLLASLAHPVGVAAAAPPNDDISAATDIGGLPFSATVNFAEATAQAEEPSDCTGRPVPTVWYRFTPASDGVVRFSLTPSPFGVIGAYSGDAAEFSRLGFVGCSAMNVLPLEVSAGTTYFLQVAWTFSTGSATFSVEEMQPPANDDFAAAGAITAIPFEGSADTSGATTEPGEPFATCNAGAQTVWWRLDATEDRAVLVSAQALGPAYLGVWSGTSLDDLAAVGCRDHGSSLLVELEAGRTYWFQVAPIFFASPPVTLRIADVPDPTAWFGWWPSDPSSFDDVQFFDGSWDPAGMGIVDWSWDFGDGALASGCCPARRFAADGDHIVRLDVTTADGRTASVEQLVHVETHDVSIARINAPKAASAGQTRTISVEVRTARYTETVVVDLYRSVPGGYAHVGSVTHTVPVLPANRSVSFDFAYAFDASDAELGKVMFKAVASTGTRDALPGDNELLSGLVKVTR